MKKFVKGLAAVLSVIITILLTIGVAVLMYGVIAFLLMVGLGEAFGLKTDFVGLFILVTTYFVFFRKSGDK